MVLVYFCGIFVNALEIIFTFENNGIKAFFCFNYLVKECVRPEINRACNRASPLTRIYAVLMSRDSLFVGSGIRT